MHKFNDEGKVVLSPREDATNHGLLSNLSSSLPEDSPVLAALGKLVGEGAFEDIQNNPAQISARGKLLFVILIIYFCIYNHRYEYYLHSLNDVLPLVLNTNILMASPNSTESPPQY